MSGICHRETVPGSEGIQVVFPKLCQGWGHWEGTGTKGESERASEACGRTPTAVGCISLQCGWLGVSQLLSGQLPEETPLTPTPPSA